jgi:hypothetical protein
VHQRAAERELLLHAARELACGPVGESAEARAVKQVVDARRALGSTLAEQPGEEVDVLGDGEGGIEVPPQPLRHKGDAGADGPPMGRGAHRPAERGRLAGLEPPHACDQPQQGGFPHPVGPDQPHHPPRRDRHADVVERDRRAVAVRDRVELRNGRG